MRLSGEDLFMESTIKESITDVELPNRPISGNNNGKDHMD